MIDWDEKKEKGKLFTRELFDSAEKTDLSSEEKLATFMTVASLYACELGFSFDEFKKRLGNGWLTEWNEYIADDVHPGKMPIEVELEVMQIITADAFIKTPSQCTPTGLTAHAETCKGRVFWKLKTTTRESEKPNGMD